MKTAIITGITGQDGFYLASLLLSKGYMVVGIQRRTSVPHDQRLKMLDHQNLILVNGDVTDSSCIHRIVAEYMPDEFYHLAAQSHVGFSSEAPQITQDINCTGTTNTLEAVKDLVPDCRYYFAASSEMFGNQLDETIVVDRAPSVMKLNELSTLAARSPYGASKIFGYNMTRHYREAYDIFACAGILFNHESPLRGENFVTRKITKSIADIMAGKSDKITLGNIDAKRDWGFAGDYVKAMHLMLNHSEPDDFVIATGECYSVRDFLLRAFKHTGWPLSDELEQMIDKYVKFEKRFLRPSDINVLLGDAKKAKEILGWEPTISFDKLVQSMMKYDLAEVSGQSGRHFVGDALLTTKIGDE